jgi:YihY family inner membrane protein
MSKRRHRGPVRWALAIFYFWLRLNFDWVFNFTGMLAFGLLGSLFPIAITLISVLGFVLGRLDPQTQHILIRSIQRALPSNVSPTVVSGVYARLATQSGLIGLVGLLGSFYFGSRLFMGMENAFDVIYRLRTRNPVRQNIMAFSMVVVLIILTPIMIGVSTIPSIVAHSGIYRALPGPLHSPVGASVISALTGVAVAFILFEIIYVVVPNRHMQWAKVWPGALAAAIAVEVANIAFPIYVARFIRPSSYGAVAGTILVFIIYFYVFALILLIGAELNARLEGQATAKADIATLLAHFDPEKEQRAPMEPLAGRPHPADHKHKPGPWSHWRRWLHWPRRPRRPESGGVTA